MMTNLLIILLIGLFWIGGGFLYVKILIRLDPNLAELEKSNLIALQISWFVTAFITIPHLWMSKK